MDFDSILGAIVKSTHLAAQVFADAMKKEYERGVADGRREAAAELRTKLSNVLDAPVSAKEGENATQNRVVSAVGRATGRAVVVGVGRAARGSVAPKVMGALADSIKGKKPAEIAAETGVPENSVRGMLNKLRKENRVFKAGDVWRPVGPQKQPDGSTLEVKPEGHLVSVPAHLVRNGNPGAGSAGADS